MQKYILQCGYHSLIHDYEKILWYMHEIIERKQAQFLYHRTNTI
jgi:hypothetical protein